MLRLPRGSSMAEFRYETDRLLLRDWQDSDWEPFWQATNTPAVMEWLGGVCDDAKRSAAQQRLLTYQQDHGHTFWAVERRDDGVILGFFRVEGTLEFRGTAWGPLAYQEFRHLKNSRVF